MNKKIYDPFEKMSKKHLSKMINVDADSRNLKDKDEKAKGVGNFLHIQTNKKAS